MAQSVSACVDELLGAGPASDAVRVHVLFCGHVQGVGFRWNLQSFAEEAGVAGWVENLPDGSTVEAELEGTRMAVAQLILRMHVHYEQFRAWFSSGFEVASLETVQRQRETGFTVRV